jgi:hypothetical protein
MANWFLTKLQRQFKWRKDDLFTKQCWQIETAICKKYLDLNFIQKMNFKMDHSRVPVAHACNPSYSGSGDQEDHGSKPAQANSSQDPISKKPITKKCLWSGSWCRPWVQTSVSQVVEHLPSKCIKIWVQTQVLKKNFFKANICIKGDKRRICLYINSPFCKPQKKGAGGGCGKERRKIYWGSRGKSKW